MIRHAQSWGKAQPATAPPSLDLADVQRGAAGSAENCETIQLPYHFIIHGIGMMRLETSERDGTKPIVRVFWVAAPNQSHAKTVIGPAKALSVMQCFFGQG